MVDDRLAQLESRIGRIEDELQILRLIAAYGPCADSGSGDIAKTLFSENALYDSGLGVLHGAEAIQKMIYTLPLHLDLMATGCAHTTDVPVIDVQGDRASAVAHGFLLRREGDGFVAWRATSVRWEFERSDGRWLIASRVNRLLNGEEAARAHFRSGLLQGLHLDFDDAEAAK